MNTVISRIAALTASLAIVAGASLAFNASAHQAPTVGAKAVRTVMLDTVVVTAKRLPSATVR